MKVDVWELTAGLPLQREMTRQEYIESLDKQALLVIIKYGLVGSDAPAMPPQCEALCEHYRKIFE